MKIIRNTQAITLVPHYYPIAPQRIMGRESRESATATARPFTITRVGVKSARWAPETGWTILPWFGIGSAPIVPDLTDDATADFVAEFVTGQTPNRAPLVVIDGVEATS